MATDVDSIVKAILSEGAKQGGNTWDAIRKSAPLYVKAYAQNLADIAEGVAAEQISKKDAKMYVKNAKLLLVMGIANTSEIVLHSVQVFVDGVISILKGVINAKLPIPIL